MPTSEIVMQRAVELAAEGTDTEDAVLDLLAVTEGRRVSAVLARQHLLGEPGETVERAVALLDEVLHRMPEM